MTTSTAIRIATTTIGLVFAGVAAAQQLSTLAPLTLEPLPASANSWPWIAFGGILVVLGAISVAARRLLPFGKRNGR